MERRDYLVKQAEQLGQVLGKILFDLLRIKTQNVVNLDIQIVDKTLTDALDFDLDQTMAISADQFLTTLRDEKHFSNENLEQLTNILLLISDDMASDEQMSLSEKCLCIYDYLDKTWNTYSFDRYLKIEKLKNRINSNNMSRD